MSGGEGWTNEQIQVYVEEHWPLISSHPDDCTCDACWEYYVITEK